MILNGGIFVGSGRVHRSAVAFLRPGRYGEAQKQLVYGVNHAHRGLHTKDKTVPENSLPAFRAAAEAGYGVELDIQLSRDGQVVVFHDDTLDRVCGVHGRVDEFTFEELRGMRLCGTQETIPLLTEVFEVMGGRTPMIIELKTGRRNDELCEKGLALMRAYNGPYCIESFDPRIVRWFRKMRRMCCGDSFPTRPPRFGMSRSRWHSHWAACSPTCWRARSLSLTAPAKSHGPPVWRRQWAPSAYAGPCAPKTI